MDQEVQIGNGSVRIQGGEIASVMGTDCTEEEPGLWFCTGTQGTSVSLTACLVYELYEQGPAGVDCQPGSFSSNEGCIGQGNQEICAKGFTYDSQNECCTPQPNIPYPGCDLESEFLTAVITRESGSPPLGDTCAVISVPLVTCRQPGGSNGGSCSPAVDCYTAYYDVSPEGCFCVCRYSDPKLCP